ncbi:MAG: succinyldiaminopimelate transaminase [Halieaceae bacterium]|jgi:N-succinyldiaminopimelate aminotransferase|nr:succinyldiaminopimelate transaminase [Halieaceae bacterium]
MNPQLELLQTYPFEKLRQLFADITPNPDKRPISLSMGEPRHSSPEFVLQQIAANLDKLSSYPATRGLPELRESIVQWLSRRFGLSALDPDRHALPVNGTREALFAFAQTVVRRQPDATVICPNPFYQIYEGAALLAGAQPHFLNCSAATGFAPDFDALTDKQWQQCQLLYLCSPGNPTGAVIPLPRLQWLVAMAQKHNVVIASDECYSEIYSDESKPPPGLLQACESTGVDDYRNCIVFHSLSKRSNLPGMRSGFVAGDSRILNDFLQYRTYHGCAMPLHHQLASIAAWSDEEHVLLNRQQYRDKFAAVLAIFDGQFEAPVPDASFYLWPRTPIADTEFARQLYATEHVTVLPGRFLAREAGGVNPGENRIRLALVADLDQCVDAAQRIVHCLGRV